MTVAEFFQRYFPIKEDWTAWDILNSEIFVGVFILIIGYLINRQLKDVQHESMELNAMMETLARNMSEAEMPEFMTDRAAEEAEAMGSSAPGQAASAEVQSRAPAPQEENYREQAQAIIDALKIKLEHIVANEPDGRYRRTFEKIRRYDYRQLVIALYERGRLDDLQYNTAMAALTVWNRYIRGVAANKVVPAETYAIVSQVVSPFELDVLQRDLDRQSESGV